MWPLSKNLDLEILGIPVYFCVSRLTLVANSDFFFFMVPRNIVKRVCILLQ